MRPNVFVVRLVPGGPLYVRDAHREQRRTSRMAYHNARKGGWPRATARRVATRGLGYAMPLAEFNEFWTTRILRGGTPT